MLNLECIQYITIDNEYIFKIMKCLIFVDCKCATAKESKEKQRKCVKSDIDYMRWINTTYYRGFSIGIFTAIHHFNFYVKLHAFFEQMQLNRQDTKRQIEWPKYMCQQFYLEMIKHKVNKWIGQRVWFDLQQLFTYQNWLHSSAGCQLFSNS